MPSLAAQKRIVAEFDEKQKMERKMSVSSYKIKDYVLDLQKKGLFTFSLNEMRKRFPSFSTQNVNIEKIIQCYRE